MSSTLVSFDTILVVGIAILLFVCACGVLAVPKSIRELAHENCYDLQGRFHPRRHRRELRAWIGLLTDMLFMLLIILIPAGGLLMLMGDQIIPLSMIADAFREFDPDQDMWEARLEHRPEGDLGKEYERWAQHQGISRDSAQNMEVMLWRSWPAFFAIGLISLVFSYWVFGRTSVGSIAQYADGVRARSRGYLRRDLLALEDEVWQQSEPTNPADSLSRD